MPWTFITLWVIWKRAGVTKSDHLGLYNRFTQNFQGRYHVSCDDNYARLKTKVVYKLEKQYDRQDGCHIITASITESLFMVYSRPDMSSKNRLLWLAVGCLFGREGEGEGKGRER